MNPDVGSRTAVPADKDGEAIVYLADSILAVGEDAGADEYVPPGGSLISTAVDVVVIRGTVKGADAAKLLPIDMEIAVTVDLGEIGDDDEVGEKGAPLFESDATTAVTVIESTPFRTTLQAPFAIAGSGTGAGGYDTGIAVANMGSGAGAQPGAVTFKFYVAGVKMEHETSASSPSSASLNAAGMLEPGHTYAVLLGELFPNAGNGYLIITTDFMDAGANLYISDFDTFSATGSIGKKQ